MQKIRRGRLLSIRVFDRQADALRWKEWHSGKGYSVRVLRRIVKADTEELPVWCVLVRASWTATAES